MILQLNNLLALLILSGILLLSEHPFWAMFFMAYAGYRGAQLDIAFGLRRKAIT